MIIRFITINSSRFRNDLLLTCRRYQSSRVSWLANILSDYEDATSIVLVEGKDNLAIEEGPPGSFVVAHMGRKTSRRLKAGSPLAQAGRLPWKEPGLPTPAAYSRVPPDGIRTGRIPASCRVERSVRLHLATRIKFRGGSRRAGVLLLLI